MSFLGQILSFQSLGHEKSIIHVPFSSIEFNVENLIVDFNYRSESLIERY